MAPDRHLSQGAFDINILNTPALDAPGGVQTALRAIEAVCHRGGLDIAGMVAVLDSRPYILEYIISGMLRAFVSPRALPALTISLSSAGGGGLREAFKMDSHGVPHFHNTNHG
jgi:hypothetical protein